MRLHRPSDGIGGHERRGLSKLAAGASGPDRAGVVLVALILVAAVANLNLSVANVALPSIGQAFDSSQVTLNLIAVGYSLGLAASVLYLARLGDRYGRSCCVVGIVLGAFASLVLFGATGLPLIVAIVGHRTGARRHLRQRRRRRSSARG